MIFKKHPGFLQCTARIEKHCPGGPTGSHNGPCHRVSFPTQLGQSEQSLRDGGAFSHSCGGWKFKIEALAGWFLRRPRSLACGWRLPCVSSQVLPLWEHPCISVRPSSHQSEGFRALPHSFILSHLSKGPVSKHVSHILRYWGFELQRRNFGGDTTQIFKQYVYLKV